MPNALAYLAVFLTIPVGIGLFFVVRPALATLAVFFGAVLLLPELTELDLPGLPGIGKEEAAAIACLLGVALRARRKLRDARMLRGPDRWIVVFMLGALGTSLTNTDELVFGPQVLPSLGVHEAISVMFSDFLLYLVPFVLGRALFTTAKELKTALGAIAIAGCVYSPFVFTELMLSPQLHNWIWGFHQHDFIQTIRGDGSYRPMVFMEHGLAVAMLLMWATVSGVILMKAKKRAFMFPAPLVTAYVAVWLFWVKSLGALIYAVTLAPVVAMLRPQNVLRVALILSAIVFSYPILRAFDVFPDRALVNAAYNASGDRAASLDYRFTMESMLAERASDRPVFGWGRFKRNMVIDPETGKDLSVSDGFWVVIYGVRGGLGFVCFFAYLLSPIFLLRKRLRRVAAPEEKVMLTGLALLVSVSAVDLLPNGLYNSLPVFFAGILYGATRALSSQPPSTVSEAVPIVRSVR